MVSSIFVMLINLKVIKGNKMTDEIKVLDHGYIRLVDRMGSDLSVVRSARVSYNAEWRAGEDKKSDTRLINYLWKHRHSTPFEAVTFTFEVKAPIFVIRQWQRHRTQSYNELSARYTELPNEYYIPNPKEIGVQSKANKQARNINSTIDYTDRFFQCTEFSQHNRKSFSVYNEFLEKGWSRELARTILPLSTYTRMFTTANLLNFLKFINLRDDERAQYEIQVYAKAMLELMRPFVPVTIDAYEKDIAEKLEILRKAEAYDEAMKETTLYS